VPSLFEHTDRQPLIHRVVFGDQYMKNKELVNPNERRATFDATVFAHSVDAFVIGDKIYGYHLLLSTTGGTVHDSDMRGIVVLCHPHSDFSRNGVRHYSSADFGNEYHFPFGEA
jgi:hypothetical protein